MKIKDCFKRGNTPGKIFTKYFEIVKGENDMTLCDLAQCQFRDICDHKTDPRDVKEEICQYYHYLQQVVSSFKDLD